MKARIIEQGNGFPDWSDRVQDANGGLWLIVGESTGPIQTGDERGNWLLVEVEEADWFDMGPDEEPFPALCVPVSGEGGAK